MVDKVARLHFQHASPAGALRMLSGLRLAPMAFYLTIAQLMLSL